MRLILAIIGLLLFSSCGKKLPVPIQQQLNAPQDIAGDSVILTSLPMAKGNSWTYTVESQTSSKIYTTEYTTTIINDTIVNGLHVYVFDNRPIVGPIWLAGSTTPMLVKYKSKYYFIPSFARADSSSINDSCELMVQYPATINEAWVQKFNTTSVARDWFAYVKVTTLAGSFNCLKMDVSGTMLGNAAHYLQYFGEKGLVQEVQIYSFPGGAANGGPQTEIIVRTLKSVNF